MNILKKGSNMKITEIMVENVIKKVKFGQVSSQQLFVPMFDKLRNIFLNSRVYKIIYTNPSYPKMKFIQKSKKRKLWIWGLC